MNITESLQEIVGNRVKENEPMSKHTNFRIGGPTRWFVEVRSVKELQRVLVIAHEQDVKHAVFGGGSNMLVSDKGYDGMMIKMALRKHEINGTRVRAEAGVLSVALARATAMAGLKGLTWAISLPGTIGGAVRGNAGCFGGEIKDHLVEVELFRNNEVVTVPASELKMSYRESTIKHSDDIVLAAIFELEEGDSEVLIAELAEKLASRKATQPLDAGSAGCLFKNYKIKDDEELQRLAEKFDIPAEMMSARRISAGWLIDKMDLKGFSVGGAKISEVHGNFVVNNESATADEVAQLMAIVKTRVKNEFGIHLQEEVEYIGFEG